MENGTLQTRKYNGEGRQRGGDTGDGKCDLTPPRPDT